VRKQQKKKKREEGRGGPVPPRGRRGRWYKGTLSLEVRRVGEVVV